MSFTERNGSLCIIQQVVGVMVVAVNVTVYGYIQPYKSLLANLLEIAVNINFLFLLLINSTSFFHDDMFTFSDISSNITSSDCGSSIAGIAHVSWLLMPVYYLPILGLSITAAVFAIHFIRYHFNMSPSMHVYLYAMKGAYTTGYSYGSFSLWFCMIIADIIYSYGAFCL